MAAAAAGVKHVTDAGAVADGLFVRFSDILKCSVFLNNLNQKVNTQS